VRCGVEIESLRFSPLAHHDIIFFVLAHRYRGVGDIWYLEKEVIQLLLDVPDGFLEVMYLASKLATFLGGCLSVPCQVFAGTAEVFKLLYLPASLGI